MEKRGIGVSNLPNQRYRSSFNKELSYNILIIGEPGLGKSSFINLLLNSTITDSESKDSANKYCFRITEQGYKLKLTILEVNCPSNLVNNENCHLPITNYLSESFDTHLILFFYDTLSSINVYLMDQLSRFTNLICVLAKADINCKKEVQYENYCFNVARNCSYGSVNSQFGELKERVVKQLVELVEKSKYYRKMYRTQEMLKEMGIVEL